MSLSARPPWLMTAEQASSTWSGGCVMQSCQSSALAAGSATSSPMAAAARVPTIVVHRHLVIQRTAFIPGSLLPQIVQHRCYNMGLLETIPSGKAAHPYHQYSV